jgi:hypothetical protein
MDTENVSDELLFYGMVSERTVQENRQLYLRFLSKLGGEILFSIVRFQGWITGYDVRLSTKLRAEGNL